MTLFELLNEIEYDGAPINSEVSGVTSDSRIVSEGKVFVAIKGLKFDGHDHAEKALKAGAVAVVCERDLKLPNQIIVKNSRSAYAYLCSKIHGEPSKKLKLIGVTGTNGKTTTTTIIKQILEYAGNKCGLI
ncbi:MAG: UDP-N-acetylmuramoyl-L-alanyl-D-glutamate--2,6-diaminopimelate ligase, partial [Oscillospiraceae bacterium]|nr:UDP-N-acetylmuramoyl-L-alanyl-D-glutamate--2,6-diaminopimelate ligase [Oscillospiraceae bacterium]